ncbi:hypothetical protein B0H67DRAFT_218054 [Lasiosphaeris hirsuta]|uniref:Uncharacterized protein n=1 Tax=Lasiosphaeris hirsuta TaxID=260670 RepID=A0AA40AEZ6_9PEZI|nr:hypothetical protein B0H67DRAFT_218054 [Lasiosphaeris hirsuta]
MVAVPTPLAIPAKRLSTNRMMPQASAHEGLMMVAWAPESTNALTLNPFTSTSTYSMCTFPKTTCKTQSGSLPLGVEGQGLTLRVVLHGVLQVLHDPLLADDLFNLGLGLDIEGILVQLLNLLMAHCPLPPLPIVALRKYLRKPLWVVKSRRQLWPLPVQLASQVWISKDLQPNQLGVLLSGSRPGAGARLRGSRSVAGGDAGGAANVADVESEHFAVANLQLAEGLCVLADELAVVVEVL